MRLFSFGKQATIFGLPISLALLFLAFFYISSIANAILLVRLDWPYVKLHHLGQIISSHFDLPRVYCIIKMLTAVFWGCVIIVNVAIFRRAIWLAYITFGFACLYYCEVVFGLTYGLFALFQGKFIESQHAYHRVHIKLLGGWPMHFWIIFGAHIAAGIIVVPIVLDMHWSFIKILQYGGSGWESKAFYEIHQSRGETVASLQAQWDLRMGLHEKRNPELERILKRRELEEKDETTPLRAEV